MKRLLVHFWRGGEPRLNYGEALIEPIVRFFGDQLVPDIPLNRSLSAPVVLMIGSELYREHVEQVRAGHRKVIVWGYGHSHGHPPDISLLDIRAVRGECTRTSLQLSASLPCADPGFLLPQVFPIDAHHTGPALWAPHLHNRSHAHDRAAQWEAEYFDVDVRPSRIAEHVTRIANSRFVYTSSLHVTITCLAYGTPFALCLAPGDKVDKPAKWEDIWSTLTNPPPLTWCQDPTEAATWWTSAGQHARPPETTALLEAFPHDAAF